MRCRRHARAKSLNGSCFSACLNETGPGISTRLDTLTQNGYKSDIRRPTSDEKVRDLEGSTRVRVGIDVGGTHTDLVVLDDDGELTSASKVPTTPHDISIGILDVLVGSVSAGDVAQ